MKESRAREIQESIRQVLLHDWDPIGVEDEPGAQGEYDSYVGALYRLLIRGASEREIADHLRGIEIDRMGISPVEPSHLLPVARKLKALDIRFVDSGPTA